MPDAPAESKPNSVDSLAPSRLAVYDTLMTTPLFPLFHWGEVNKSYQAMLMTTLPKWRLARISASASAMSASRKVL